MADIARETGLTLATVSRALNTNGKYAIAPETRARVAEVAARLGYRPNLMGRALASGSASLVLLVTPDPFGPYYVEINRHLSIQAARHGFSFVSGGTLVDPSKTTIAANDWLYGVDGIIVCDYLSHQESHILEAMRLKTPVVAMGLRYPFPHDFVGVDIHTASLQLVQHLLDQGCTHPAMLISPGAPESDPRLSAYLKVTQAAGMKPRVIRSCDQRRVSGQEAIHEHFRSGRIDGLFCENDLLAVGAYRGLTDLGIRVPEDVLLAGCDGLEDALYQHTPITSIYQPIPQMCEVAWAMLQARMDGSSEPARIANFTAELQIRASTCR